MYQTIMVPTEGSGFDREAIRVALRLATKSDAAIHLVRVAGSSPPIAIGVDGIAMTGDAMTNARDRELADLYMLAEECRENTSADIVTVLEDGPVSVVLESYAARVCPDIIVITSHARRGFARLAVGSVTDALIRNAHVPVLVVKPEPSYLNPRAAERITQIVIPLDGSTLAEQILQPAITLAELEQAKIVLLRIISDEGAPGPENGKRPWWENDLESARIYLNEIAAGIRSERVDVTTDIVVGRNVAEAITTFARQRRAELVAIATHGRSGMQRAVRGSVADELTRSVGISLLVLRPVSVGGKYLDHATERCAVVST